MRRLSFSRLKPWRLLLALMVLPCLIGADSARQYKTLITLDVAQLSDGQTSTLTHANIQYRLLRYADIQGQGPYPEQALFYTELLAQLPQLSAAAALSKPQAAKRDSLSRKHFSRAPPVVA